MKRLQKYAIVIGENNESVCRKVQIALNEAGFYWRSGAEIAMIGSVSLGLNSIRDGEISYSLRGAHLERGFPIGTKIITPSDVLNGKAFELDGAKKPEPRYFLSAVNMDVVKVKNGKNEWMGFNGVAKETSLDIEYLNGNCPELTKSDVAYIRDNASKAKELGMTLRKPDGGDDIIGYFGMSYDIDGEYDYLGEVAGHRYCRKTAERANYCSECGTKLSR